MILIIEGQPLMKKYRIQSSNRLPTKSIGISRISTIPDITVQHFVKKKESKYNVIDFKELIRKNIESKQIKTPQPQPRKKITIPELHNEDIQQSQTITVPIKNKVIYLLAKRKLYFKSFNSSISSLKLN